MSDREKNVIGLTSLVGAVVVSMLICRGVSGATSELGFPVGAYQISCAQFGQFDVQCRTIDTRTGRIVSAASK